MRNNQYNGGYPYSPFLPFWVPQFSVWPYTSNQSFFPNQTMSFLNPSLAITSVCTQNPINRVKNDQVKSENGQLDVQGRQQCHQGKKLPSTIHVSNKLIKENNLQRKATNVVREEQLMVLEQNCQDIQSIAGIKNKQEIDQEQNKLYKINNTDRQKQQKNIRAFTQKKSGNKQKNPLKPTDPKADIDYLEDKSNSKRNLWSNSLKYLHKFIEGQIDTQNRISAVIKYHSLDQQYSVQEFAKEYKETMRGCKNYIRPKYVNKLYNGTNCFSKLFRILARIYVKSEKALLIAHCKKLKTKAKIQHFLVARRLSKKVFLGKKH